MSKPHGDEDSLVSDYGDVQIDTAVLLETLRNMQSYRHLTPNDSSMYMSPFRTQRKCSHCIHKLDWQLTAESPEYRSSLRAVSQLSGADGGVSKPKLTIRELEGVITPEVGLNHIPS